MDFFKKKLYATKTTYAGGTKIEVRQVVGKGTDSAVQAIGAAGATAKQWLNNVIPLRNSWQQNEQLGPLFRFFFHTDPKPENVNIVWSVLGLINSGLQKPFGVKISDSDPSTLGYVTGYWAACPKKDGNVYLYDADDEVMRRKGEIHIYRGILNRGDYTTVTLVHEAGHRFANLDDFGDEGYFTEDYSGMDSYTLQWQKCMRNADSYAAFVYFVSNPELAKRLMPKIAERAARARAAGEDVSYDLSSIFG